MMRLRWTRTMLCALAFVWVMIEYHASARKTAAAQAHVEELIARVCARASAQVDHDTCEIGYRVAGLGGGASVHGSVDVSGSVDVR